MEAQKSNYGTIEHFKTLYHIATKGGISKAKEGIVKALEFDAEVTALRHPTTTLFLVGISEMGVGGGNSTNHYIPAGNKCLNIRTGEIYAEKPFLNETGKVIGFERTDFGKSTIKHPILAYHLPEDSSNPQFVLGSPEIGDRLVIDEIVRGDKLPTIIERIEKIE